VNHFEAVVIVKKQDAVIVSIGSVICAEIMNNTGDINIFVEQFAAASPPL
jgi:hypothetical protein